MSGVIITLLPGVGYTSIRPDTRVPYHTTVLYFGLEDQVDKDRIREYWASMKTLWTTPIDATVTGETYFPAPEGWAHVDLIDGPYLPDFRSAAQEMAEVFGIKFDRLHGFLPHITRQYVPMVRDSIEHTHWNRRPEFTYDRMALWMGSERLEQELR